MPHDYEALGSVALASYDCPVNTTEMPYKKESRTKGSG
jgi:hypothetical protein